MSEQTTVPESPVPAFFLEDLAADPEDFDTRSVLADWCLDNHLPAWADCLRWQVASRKRPMYLDSFDHKPLRTGDGVEGMCLWYRGVRNTLKIDPASDLPDNLFHRLADGHEDVHHTAQYWYTSVPAAELSLWRAWERCLALGVDPLAGDPGDTPEED